METRATQRRNGTGGGHSPLCASRAPSSERLPTGTEDRQCSWEAASASCRAVTVGHVAAPVLLLEVSSMARGESVDGTALRFLTKKAIERQKEVKKERRRRRCRDILRRFRADLPVSDAEWEAWQAWRGIGSSASGMKRKRTKRRKRRTPRSSSRSSYGRARRRQWLRWLRCISRCVPSCKTQLLGIVAGMFQKESYALFGPGSGMCKARFAGILHLAQRTSRGFCRQARR